MKVNEILSHLEVEGFTVIEGVIPEKEAADIGHNVATTTATRGNKGGTPGIDATSGLISSDQSFADYLADPRIIGTAEAFFGQHVRISFTTSIINNPGNARGSWHSDWPFNQLHPAHIPAPYPNTVQHLTTIWMLSPFSIESGGTLVVPGSHHSSNNPTGDNGLDKYAAYPTETQATGKLGDVLIFDSRLWHATATNHGEKPRVGLAVRYAPWWLNLDTLMPGSADRLQIVDEPGLSQPYVTPIPQTVFNKFSNEIKPLFRHWVR